MDLKLGTDMGVVMAKGVVLGVFSAVVILPALILVFDKPIHKHKHKVLIPKLQGVANFTTTHYKGILIAAVALLIPFAAAAEKNRRVLQPAGLAAAGSDIHRRHTEAAR